MAEHPLVYIVVVTWKQKQDTLECLESVFRLSYPGFRVVLVDNNSTDGTREAVAAQFPTVEYIANSTNRGFSAAVNQGMRHGLERGAEYLFLLNNDTIVDAALLDHLVAQATDESVGMLVPKIYYYARPNVIWSVGAGLNRWTLETQGEMRGSTDTGQWETVIERIHVTACAVLLPRRLTDKIGLLDERFFYYYDDADLSLRVHEAGFKTLLVPRAKMWHKVSRASGGSDTSYQRYWLGYSSVLFFRKHVRGWRWLIVLPYRLGSAVKTAIRLAVLGKFAALDSYWRGLFAGLADKR